MKTDADIETRLLNELNQWHGNQMKNEYEDYYLYFLPTTAEHIGGILICKERPANPEYQLAWNEHINKAATVNQNFNFFRNNIIRSLPILEI